jgi:hypothetical protein
MSSQGSGIGFWALLSLMALIIILFSATCGFLYVLSSSKVSVFAKIVCGGCAILLWQVIRADHQISRGLKTTPNYAEFIFLWILYSLFLSILGLFVISMLLAVSGFAMEDFLKPSTLITWAVIVFGGVGWFFLGQLKQRKQK